MKIGIISQARMTSTRLPGKVLKLIGGQPMLKYHTDRLNRSGMPVFIATTINKTDDPIVAFCQEENIPFFRGSEDNVLSRYYACAKQNNLDVIVRVTSDCPLIDGNLLNESWQKHKAGFTKFTYLSNCMLRTFPRGLDFEMFSFAYLKEAYEKADTLAQKEHVTPYIHQNITGQTHFVDVTNQKNASNFRITVDTQEDFDLIAILIEKYKVHKLFTNGIIKTLYDHPELVAINALIEQKKL